METEILNVKEGKRKGKNKGPKKKEIEKKKSCFLMPNILFNDANPFYTKINEPKK